MDFKRLLEKEFIFLDGAMGTQLQQHGLTGGAAPDILNITQPDIVAGIHTAYAQAGADIVYANTFGANRCKLAGTGYSVEEVVSSGIAAAKKSGAFTALDIGPTGELSAPFGTLEHEDFIDIFAEQLKAGASAGAQLAAIETMSDLNEMRAAVLAVKENSTLPVICTMTFNESGRTFTGCSAKAMALTLEGMGVDALGVNCSLGPDRLSGIVKEISEWSSLPIVVKANAGMPDPVTGKYPMTPEAFAAGMLELVPYGVRIIGGCCGTSPQTIAAVRAIFSTASAVKDIRVVPRAICNSANILQINNSLKISAEIDTSKNESLRQALADGDTDYVTELALEQTDEGAEVLCISTEAPGIDEAAALCACVAALQSSTLPPLMLKSNNFNALEKALRMYPGRALIKTSCSCSSLESKYGAVRIS